MTAAFNQMEKIMSLAPVIPVITLSELSQAVPLAQALVKGGLRVLEITLRTPIALDAIKLIAEQVPDAIVGAGTVVRSAQVDQVVRAGARFCVSPGCTPSLLQTVRDAQTLLLPGAVTASEVMNLLSWDVSFMKFFPAKSSGGVAALKSLNAPLPEAKFCPTGGINASSAPDYLALPNVLCVGGSWLSPGDFLCSGQWSKIEDLAVHATKLCVRLRRTCGTHGDSQ